MSAVRRGCAPRCRRAASGPSTGTAMRSTPRSCRPLTCQGGLANMYVQSSGGGVGGAQGSPIGWAARPNRSRWGLGRSWCARRRGVERVGWSALRGPATPRIDRSPGPVPGAPRHWTPLRTPMARQGRRRSAFLARCVSGSVKISPRCAKDGTNAPMWHNSSRCRCGKDLPDVFSASENWGGW